MFDEDVPRKLARSLPLHEIHTVVNMQWGGIKNGALLTLIERKALTFFSPATRIWKPSSALKAVASRCWLAPKMTLPKISILLLGALVPGVQSPRDFAPATLVEAVEYEPCDYYCGPMNHPATAYCIYVDGQIVVGERAGILWFGESDAASMRNLVGKQITARFDARSIWISYSNQRALKIKRGANFEQFTDTRCLVEVHKPKLAIASKAARPSNLPADAFPLAGEQGGDIQHRSVFVWFSCTAKPTMSTIDCLKWYPAGASRGIERYCARTVDGVSVPSDFRIDPLASREGQIVLTSGGILQLDHRGRVNDELISPAGVCR